MIKRLLIGFTAALIAHTAFAADGAALVSTSPSAPTAGQCAQFTNANTVQGVSCGSGSGSVTSVATGTGLTGGPITSTGTISVNSSVVPLIGAANVFTNSNIITAGSSILNANFLQLKPSDFATGKPGLYFKKTSTASLWELGINDGTNTNGTINIAAQNLTWNGSALLTAAGTGLASLTGSNTFTGSNAFTGNFITITNGTAASSLATLIMGPSDFGVGKGQLVLGNNGANSWLIEGFDGTVGVGTLDLRFANLTLNGSPILTAGGSGFAALSGANTFTNTNTFTVGSTTSGGSYAHFRPSDFGAGKPQLVINKDVGNPNTWTVGLNDGTGANTGTINWSATNNIISGNLTVTGAVVCGSGCSGGGGGGGYATVYDVAGTYGGDPTGTTPSTAAFNNAMSACNATGGVVWFRAGTFKLGAVTMTGNHCDVVGNGALATTLNFSGVSGNCLTMSQFATKVENLRVLNCTSGYAIAMTAFVTPLINHIRIENSANGIYVSSVGEGRINDVGMSTIPGNSIRCDGSVGQVFGLRISQVQKNDGAGDTSSEGISTGSGCNTIAMSQVAFGQGNHCFHADPGAGAFVIMDDFECDHSQNGVLFEGSAGVQITNSWFGSVLGSSGAGLAFFAGFGGAANISNNYFPYGNAGTKGIYICGGDSGTQATATIVGNIIYGYGGGGIDVCAGVKAFTIANNQIGTPPPSNTGTAQAYCIKVESGSSDWYSINNNVCGTNNTTGIVDNGTGTHKSVTGNVQ